MTEKPEDRESVLIFGEEGKIKGRMDRKTGIELDDALS